MKQLYVSILEPKDIGNCSNKGISSKRDSLTLVWDYNKSDLEELKKEEYPNQFVILKKRFLFGRDYYHCEPLIKPNNAVGPMAGGCYVKTSDSRFPLDYPIPLHDRFETPKEYARYSR